MKLARRQFLHLAAGAAALQASTRIAYDLSLLFSFRHIKPLEEKEAQVRPARRVFQ